MRLIDLLLLIRFQLCVVVAPRKTRPIGGIHQPFNELYSQPPMEERPSHGPIFQNGYRIYPRWDIRRM